MLVLGEDLGCISTAVLIHFQYTVPLKAVSYLYLFMVLTKYSLQNALG